MLITSKQTAKINLEKCNKRMEEFCQPEKVDVKLWRGEYDSKTRMTNVSDGGIW